MSEQNHEDFDVDINHYTVHDLLELFSLDQTAKLDLVKKQTQEFIENADTLNQLTLKKFYIEAQHKLLHSYNSKDAHSIHQDNTDTLQNETKNIGNFYNYEKLGGSGPDFSKENKTVNNVEFFKGDKNPVFKNTYHCIVNIDSAFRQDTSVSNSNITSSFKSTLTFALSNVIEYTVYSFEIPYSWYAFSSTYGNTIVIIDDTTITIADGNYTAADLISTVNTEFSVNGFSDITLTLSSTTNKITITNSSTTTDYSINFFEVTNPIFSNSFTDINLGCNLGFTVDDTLTLSANTSVTAPSTIYIYGTRYLLLKINDYSLNRASSSLIGTILEDTKCKYPSYLSRDLPTTSTGDNSTSVNVDNDSLPKRLTQAKAYTINAILDARSTNTNATNSSLEVSSDIMLKIPIPDQTAILNTPNKCYGETGGFLSTYKREFFGKVNLFKLHSELLDDKGRLLDLNGQNWSYTLLVKHLYQY